MSVALDVLDRMIADQATSAVPRTKGAELGASIYLQALVDAKSAVLRAETKALEEEIANGAVR